MGGSFKWPRLSEVLEYRRQVRELVINIIETAPLQLPVTQDHPWVSHRIQAMTRFSNVSVLVAHLCFIFVSNRF